MRRIQPGPADRAGHPSGTGPAKVRLEHAVISSSLDPFLSLVTLAAYSGLSVRTLRNHLRRRVLPLPHYQVGGKILVRRSEFDRWIVQFRRMSQRDATGDQLADCVNELFDSLTKRRAPAENRPSARRE